jgi:hypothetical protein
MGIPVALTTAANPLPMERHPQRRPVMTPARSTSMFSRSAFRSVV